MQFAPALHDTIVKEISTLDAILTLHNACNPQLRQSVDEKIVLALKKGDDAGRDREQIKPEIGRE